MCHFASFSAKGSQAKKGMPNWHHTVVLSALSCKNCTQTGPLKQVNRFVLVEEESRARDFPALCLHWGCGLLHLRFMCVKTGSNLAASACDCALSLLAYTIKHIKVWFMFQLGFNRNFDPGTQNPLIIFKWRDGKRGNKRSVKKKKKNAWARQFYCI